MAFIPIAYLSTPSFPLNSPQTEPHWLLLLSFRQALCPIRVHRKASSAWWAIDSSILKSGHLSRILQTVNTPLAHYETLQQPTLGSLPLFLIPRNGCAPDFAHQGKLIGVNPNLLSAVLWTED